MVSGNYTILLVASVLFFLVTSVMAEHPGRAVLEVVMIILFVSAVFTLSKRKRTSWIALAFIVAAMATRQAGRLTDTLALFVIGRVVLLLILCAGVLWILRDVLSSGAVTANRIIGAVCVYILFGLAWANLYLIMELLSPGWFSLPEPPAGDNAALEQSRFYHLLYYSFITLTTLGYGDIVRKRPPAPILAWLEAVAEQLYLTVLVPRLVALQIVGGRYEVQPKPSEPTANEKKT
ncbi:MAG: ion channel [Planctomycetota bacterium]|nr:ion channel [Planctomycetota bacterium]